MLRRVAANRNSSDDVCHLLPCLKFEFELGCPMIIKAESVHLVRQPTNFDRELIGIERALILTGLGLFLPREENADGEERDTSQNQNSDEKSEEHFVHLLSCSLFVVTVFGSLMIGLLCPL